MILPKVSQNILGHDNDSRKGAIKDIKPKGKNNSKMKQKFIF
jgi:hypothetical protein